MKTKEELNEILYNIPAVPKFITKEWLEGAYSKGMIPKKDLQVDKYYYGECRNSSVAMWDGKKFLYMRSKFGSSFVDDVECCEDEIGFDVFIPVSEIEPDPHKVIKR